MAIRCKAPENTSEQVNSGSNSDSLLIWLTVNDVEDTLYSLKLFEYWDNSNKQDTQLYLLLEKYGRYLTQVKQLDSIYTERLIKFLPETKHSSYHHQLLNLAGAQMNAAFLPDSALYFYNEAIERYGPAANDSLLEATYMGTGLSYFKKGSYEDALSFLMKAREYSVNLPDSSNFLGIQGYIASVYMDLKENEKAYQIYEEVANILIERKNFKRAIVNLSSLTNIYSQMKDTLRGVASSDKALHLADSIKADLYTYYTVYLSRAYIMRRAGRNEEALQLFDKSAEVQIKLNNPYLASRIQLFKAELLTELKRWDEAKSILSTLIPFAQENNSDPSFLMDVHGQLSLAQAATNNYKSALENSSAYYRIKDSIDVQNQALNVAKIEKEFENKEKDLLLQVREEQIKTVSQQKDIWSLITLFSLVLSGGIIYFVWIGRKRKIAQKEAELKEKFHQDLIISTEKEQSRIAMDLHDGVGSDLLVLKSKLTEIANTDTRKYIDEIIQDVRLLTKKLYPLQLTRAGLCYAVEDLIQQLDQSSPVFFSYEIDEKLNNALPEDKQLYIFRIVQEALSNVIKHAEAEAVYVAIHQSGSDIVVQIKDNGRGFIPEQQMDHSLGMKSMHHRAAIIGAAFSLQSIVGKGTDIIISIPVK